ncbi:MAG TPA: hypothetical protein VMA31_17615, partial [Bryobacteraceae bacterium]|nr:hypothetical protein [Bryobacteraceae bacterium]
SPGYKPSNKLPYAMDFNFSLQRQLSSNTVLTVAYVGTQGRKLFSQYESNPGNAALCASLRGSGVMAGTLQCGANQEDSTFTLPNGNLVYGTRTNFPCTVQPCPDFSQNTYLATVANSDFNSMQVTLERRGRNMTFLAAYTLSKSLDDASSYNTTMDFYNFALARGLSTFDVTNNFVVSYSYTLPFYKFGSLPKRLTDGWTINGITRAASGLPVSLSESGDRSWTGAGGVDRPNYVGGLVVTNNVRNTPNQQDFNKSAFTAEALGGQGTSDPRFFHGPGQVNFDLGLQKTIPLHESMNMMIRAEFFNAFNHANFLNPNGNFASSLFGRVTSAGPGRVGQVAMKFSW